MEIALPIVIAREGKWYVASCPLLDIASQGKTEDEAKKNIQALIKEYMKDPDTRKPNMKALRGLSLTTVPVTV
jgi:predicted RNase H-like HicB family nuclease